MMEKYLLAAGAKCLSMEAVSSESLGEIAPLRDLPLLCLWLFFGGVVDTTDGENTFIEKVVEIYM